HGGNAEMTGSGKGGSGGGHGGSGTDGGSGGSGGAGAGGGVLLSCQGAGGLVIQGVVNALGGGSREINGGTVKVRFAGTCPTGDILAGRVQYAALDTGGPFECLEDADCPKNAVCRGCQCEGPPDTESPLVAITSPTTAPTWNTAEGTISIGGTASDDTAVTKVEVQVNGGPWTPATGTTSWQKAGIQLDAGENTLAVRAFDDAGNVGTDSLVVFYNQGGTYDIFSIQRDLEFVAGEVTVQGNRFHVGGSEFYPKTDFLTAVSQGTDIIGYNTHCYLAQGASKKQTIANALAGSQYNSIYIYTLNQGDYKGGGNIVTPYGNGGWSFDTNALNAGRVAQWQSDIEALIYTYHLKPFLWLAADDSPDIDHAPLSKWKTYVDQMVAAFEQYPIVWVLGLEVDEYWSCAEVSERRAYLQSVTAHVVGVHLTISKTKDVNTCYKDGFDFIMAQFNSPQSNAQYVSDVNSYVLLYRPYIAAEFNVNGKGSGGEAEPTVTDRSKAIGKVIAGVGTPSRVAGIGNGIDL
ncbi:MAG: hypothetical protein GXP54_04520, partial [Deltaproteobacteria bacterium]|nr:hypothetical protein [Deltaproteobacteria bacterium]